MHVVARPRPRSAKLPKHSIWCNKSLILERMHPILAVINCTLQMRGLRDGPHGTINETKDALKATLATKDAEKHSSSAAESGSGNCSVGLNLSNKIRLREPIMRDILDVEL